MSTNSPRANGHGRRSLWSLLLDVHFQAGIADYRNSLPPAEHSRPADARLYETGRLFGAYLAQTAVVMPAFNDDGALRVGDLRRLTRAFNGAWRAGVFPDES